ncbi:GNAT family N-acetyltransferase [Sediminibacterium sp. KACHI17]|uniref:Protein ElaA n=1 Tax=Sediminibacterium sp. KACHI17 TaxID=1751071 RepID=A0AAT9GF44_9BACT
MSQYNWYYKVFKELTPHELYAIMHLRSEVFVVEQNCPYLDPDGKDLSSWHLMGWDGNKLVAYARLLPAGLAFTEVSIGRVVSSPAYRGKGAGKELMTTAIKTCKDLFGEQPIRIGAQLYLQKFYESLGFVQVSEMYLEDDIPHIEMIREVSSEK